MLEHLPSILHLKSDNEKIKGGKKKRDKGKYQRDRKKVVGRGGGISEVNIY